MNKTAVIFGGGTVTHVSPHLALCAPAYGGTARKIEKLVELQSRRKLDTKLVLTRMAGGDAETNEQLASQVQTSVDSPLTKIIYMTAAVCDWEPVGGYSPTRLDTRTSGQRTLEMAPTPKILPIVRQRPNSHGVVRKDITLVSFKVTAGVSQSVMFVAGLRMLKESSSNLVLVNDIATRMNMVVTPEESSYHVTDNRDEALAGLVEMASARSNLTFTQSTVVSGEPVSWTDPIVPACLRKVVDYCVQKNAYKPFGDATVGHFAAKLDDQTFLTSIRKSNFNRLHETGLVLVKTDGPDSVIAYGAKPSVGGQSQRTVFRDHAGFDSIVHFHCPLRPGVTDIPVVSQRLVECGSHECGQNTSAGLKSFTSTTPGGGVTVLKAVMLDNHGPNILFDSRSAEPEAIIQFIESHFDLSGKTVGFQLG